MRRIKFKETFRMNVGLSDLSKESYLRKNVPIIFSSISTLKFELILVLTHFMPRFIPHII